jgi:hypothetical protein
MSEVSTSQRAFEMIYRSADFSLCRTYRYTLWRVWNSKAPPACFIGLNPSTADELEDDPTIRRCMRFAKAWGYGGLVMANLFAFRATDPRMMKAAIDPVGPDNDAWLLRLADKAGIVIAAWGNHGSFMGRDRRVAGIIENLHCLGTTKDGSPKHPLYLRAGTALVEWANSWN